MVWEKVFYNNIAAYISLINEELKEEFPVESLSNHIKVLGGYAFKAADYRTTGIPVIRISDFQDEKIDLSGVKYFKEDNIYDRFQLFAGDIIIAMTGGTIGKLAIVQDGLGKLYLNQRVGKFQILNKEDFEPEFVYWLARGIQDKVKKLGYGGAQPNVSNSQIESLKFAFPHKNVQLKIIEFLNDLRVNKVKGKKYFNELVERRILQFQNLGVNVFSLLEECGQQRFYLQQLRQSILQEAVQGKLCEQNPSDEDAATLLTRIKAEKQKLIKEGKLKKEKELPPITEDEIPFELPKGWVWCRLAEVCDLITDGTHLTPTYVDEGRMFLSAQNVKPFKFMSEKHRYVSEEDYQGYIKNRKAEKGDILLTRVGAGIGEAAVIDIDIDFAFYVSLGLIKPNKKCIYSYYLELYLNSPLGRGHSSRNTLGKGVSAGNLNLSLIRNFEFPLPPLDEQQRIVSKVEKLQQQLNQLESQIQQSREYAEQLLQAVLKEAFEEKGTVYEENEMVSMAAEE